MKWTKSTDERSEREGKLNDESGENWRVCGNGWVGRWRWIEQWKRAQKGRSWL